MIILFVLKVNIPRFLDLAECIRNFVGLKFSSSDIEQGIACLKPGRKVFLGLNCVLSGAQALGFDSQIMVTANLWPELIIECIEHVNSHRMTGAKEAQYELNRRIKEVSSHGNFDVRLLSYV